MINKSIKTTHFFLDVNALPFVSLLFTLLTCMRNLLLIVLSNSLYDFRFKEKLKQTLVWISTHNFAIWVSYLDLSVQKRGFESVHRNLFSSFTVVWRQSRNVFPIPVFPFSIEFINEFPDDSLSLIRFQWFTFYALRKFNSVN